MLRWPLHWQIVIGKLTGAGDGLVIASLEAGRAAGQSSHAREPNGAVELMPFELLDRL